MKIYGVMQLGVDPQNCVVVEDAAAGVQAARLAGEVSSLCSVSN